MKGEHGRGEYAKHVGLLVERGNGGVRARGRLGSDERGEEYSYS
jgi:hypothetical protein